MIHPVANLNGLRLVVLTLALTTVALPGPNPTTAGCINYDDYLHWLNAMEFSSQPRGIEVQGNYAYVTEFQGSPPLARLNVVDISNESLPRIVGTLDVSGWPRGVAVSGNIVAVAQRRAGAPGLILVDVSDPMYPMLVGSALNDHLCYDVKIKDSHVFVSSDSPDPALYIFNITDPAAPDSLPRVNLGTIPNDHFALEGDFIYMISYDSLSTINISNPSAAVRVNVQSIPGGRTARGIDVDGDILLLSSYGTGPALLHGYSLIDPAVPWKRVDLDLGYSAGPRIAAAARICYLSAGTLPVEMVNVIDSATLQYIGSLPSYATGDIAYLTIRGSNLYIFRYPNNFVNTISVSSPSPLEPIGAVVTPGTAEDVVISPSRNNLAYVADGDAGLQVVDVTDPLNPIIVGSVDTPGYAVEVVLQDSIAFVADSGAGVQAVNVTVASAPTIVGSVDTPGSAVDLALSPTHAFVADSDHGVQVVDIKTPAVMTIVGAQDTLTASTGIEVTGIHAYVADGFDGLVVLNVEDPSNPWIIEGVKDDILDTALKVGYSGGNAYVTVPDSGLYIVDVTDPANPSLQGDIGTQYTAGDLDLMGIFAYVGSGNGMQLIDIRDGGNPSIVGNVEVPALTRGININEYYAYVAAGGAGLQVCPTQCGFDEMVYADFWPTPQEGFYPLTVDFEDLSEGYGLYYDWDFGDGSGVSTERNPTYTFGSPGDYPVTLIITNGVNVDSTMLVVSALAEPPTITTITDIPDDQGGFVYVSWYHSGYDTDELNRSEMYTIQRQDNGVWVTVTTSGAYGAHYYTAQVNTLGDGPQAASSFRVIAHMDEGNWASTPVTGYSEDNIAPQAPSNVQWNPDTLEWDPVAAVDLAYYHVYGAMRASFDEAVSLATTVETDIVLADLEYPWLYVVAVDDADLVSPPSAATGVTAVPEIITSVQLDRAIPNPFNPSTTLGYALPKTGHVRLAIYDVSGRLVKALVDEVTPAGRHEAIWHGKNSAGRQIASGTYFSRLEAGNVVRIGRMVLLK
ncbi:MAG: PKD domain-containing protein [bacterium]